MKEYSTKDQRLAAINALWKEWIGTVGAVTLCIAASAVISAGWMALLVAIVAWALNAIAESAKARRITGCMRFATLCAKALFISALIMAVITVLFNNEWFREQFDPRSINVTIPFIPSLIISPTVCLVCIYGMVSRNSSNFCRKCKETHGYSPEEGFVGNYFHFETRRQLKLMTAVTALVSIVDWLYYAYFYVNVNLNAPDKFFFIIFPTSIYVLSLIYEWRLLYSVIVDIRNNADNISNTARNKIVRYLIVRDDKLMLDVDENHLFDTPAEIPLDATGPLTDAEARRAFAKLAGIKEEDFKIRELYSNRSLTYRSTFCHYIVNIPGKTEEAMPDGWNLRGQWATLSTIDRLMKSGMVTPALGAEIHRVYTIAMTWKTYDRNGSRLYPIKNYRPTFRLRDVADWDVDFNDTSWFDIASNNQDKPFWRLRSLWRRTSRL